MKLNKVLALALSGVMAVSMLAGCSTNGKDDGEVVVTPVTGAASILNDKQDKVEFTNATSSELQKAATDLLATDLSNSHTLTTVNNGNVLYERLEALGVKDMTNVWDDLGDNHDEDETKTVTIIFCMDGAYSMDEVVKLVAKNIDDSAHIRDKMVMDSSNGKVYTYSYTGTVNTVTATSIDGVQSANYVMVTVTESVEAQDAV